MSGPTQVSTPASPQLAPIRLRPSRWRRRVLNALLLILAVLPWLTLVGHRGLSPLWFLLLSAFDLLLLWEWRRESRLITPDKLGCDAGGWYLVIRGVVERAEPRGSRLVWIWLQIIPLRTASATYTVVVLPDMASAEDRRHLRVWLRLGPSCADR